MLRIILAAIITAFAIGCGSGGSDSSCGPVIQNVNVPQNAPQPPVVVTVGSMEEADQVERDTLDSGGVVFAKDVNQDSTVTLTGCQIVSSGDTDSHENSNNTSTDNSEKP